MGKHKPYTFINKKANSNMLIKLVRFNKLIKCNKSNHKIKQMIKTQNLNKKRKKETKRRRIRKRRKTINHKMINNPKAKVIQIGKQWIVVVMIIKNQVEFNLITDKVIDLLPSSKRLVKKKEASIKNKLKMFSIITKIKKNYKLKVPEILKILTV